MREGKRKVLEEPREVYCLWGASDTGKSRWVREHYQAEEVYEKDPELTWWTGYEGQPVVFLDEFCSEALTLSQFKILCDPNNLNGMRVRSHGKLIWLNPSTVIFASNRNPITWYRGVEGNSTEMKAMDRRWTKIRECKDGDKLWLETNIWAGC